MDLPFPGWRLWLRFRVCISGGSQRQIGRTKNPQGLASPALKRMINVDPLSRSAQALVPPHKCGGFHHESHGFPVLTQGLKPSRLQSSAARLKQCPDTKPGFSAAGKSLIFKTGAKALYSGRINDQLRGGLASARFHRERFGLESQPNLVHDLQVKSLQRRHMGRGIGEQADFANIQI